MSLKTWEKEFYPVAASSEELATDIDRVEHSIRKWEGALKKNVEKHGLDYGGHRLWPGEFLFDGETCALCQEHGDEDGCQTCPTLAVNDSGCSSAYERSWDDPRPMIRLLRKTLKMLKGKK